MNVLSESQVLLILVACLLARLSRELGVGLYPPFSDSDSSSKSLNDFCAMPIILQIKFKREWEREKEGIYGKKKVKLLPYLSNLSKTYSIEGRRGSRNNSNNRESYLHRIHLYLSDISF